MSFSGIPRSSDDSYIFIIGFFNDLAERSKVYEHACGDGDDIDFFIDGPINCFNHCGRITGAGIVHGFSEIEFGARCNSNDALEIGRSADDSGHKCCMAKSVFVGGGRGEVSGISDGVLDFKMFAGAAIDDADRDAFSVGLGMDVGYMEVKESPVIDFGHGLKDEFWFEFG